MRIRVEAKTVGIDRKLAAAAKKLENKSAMLVEFGEMGEAGAKQAFAQSATPGGAAWPDLKASTWRRKTSGRMLWESGAMAGSYAAKPPSGDSVEVGSEGIPYTIWHHKGTSRMAARRVLPMPSYLRPRMNAIARRHLADLLN